MPTLSVQRIDVDEGSGGSKTATFRVSILDSSDEEITFNYTIRPGTSAVHDFAVGTVFGPLVGTIPAGQLSVDIAVRTRSEQFEDEVDESYWFDIFNPVNADLPDDASRITALGVIRDDEGTGSELSMFVSSPTVLERDNGTRLAVFEVHLSRASAGTLTFDYATQDGSAKAGVDYAAEAASLTFLPGELTKTVEVEILGDTAVEPSEFFSLVVTPTADIKNGTLASTGVAHVQDDDAATGSLPTISVSREQGIEVDANGPALVFKVTLSEAADEEVTVKMAGRHGSTDSTDFKVGHNLTTGVVTIAAGSTLAYVKIQIRADQIDEVDEGFWLDLYDPLGATLAGGEPVISALGVINDDDGTGSNLSLFVSSPTLQEGASGVRTAVFEVHLSHGYDQDLTFSFQTSDGSAKAGSDYVAKSGTVTFLAGQTMASVEIEIRGDGALEGSESFSLVVTPTSEIKNGSASHVGVATIVNDDSIHEIIEGDAGDDDLSGNDGNDELHGLEGEDKLDGGIGNDLLRGGGGNDQLIGGMGKDELYGDAGADVFIFAKAGESGAKTSRRDSIKDFSGQDGDVLNLKAIDANAGKGGNQAFKFIGTDEFSGAAGELRYERSGGDIIVYGNTDRDRKPEFSLLLEDINALGGSDIVL